MKRIEAVIKPEKLEPLKDELFKADINGLTINQVYGCGNQYGYTQEHIRGHAVLLNTMPKVEIKMVVPDARLEEIIDIIIAVTDEGEVGDGKIFISDIIDCIRIRTKERGDAAL